MLRVNRLIRGNLRRIHLGFILSLALGWAVQNVAQNAPSVAADALAPISRFELSLDTLTIHQSAQPRNPFSVVGETAAILGQQDGTFELWNFPVKVLSHLHLEAELADYPVSIDVNALAASIDVSPDHTTITYAHAAFTIKQHMFVARVNGENLTGAIVLFEIASVRPLTLTIQFDPVMQRMWPAENPGRPAASWVTLGTRGGAYLLNTDDPYFNAIIAMPGTRSGILPPYQERQKDHPLEFKIDFDPGHDSDRFFPLVASVIDGGGLRGNEAIGSLTRTTIDLLQHIRQLYLATHSYYQHFFDSRLTTETPDSQFDQALRWAELSIDQLKVNHRSELGLIAGVYPSSDSDRPGFGWFFGRDTLWTLYAVDSYGDFSLARHALEFLIARQRKDGKIMHEYSQSAERVDWEHYGYEYAAADSSPLFVMAVEDYLRASGDKSFVQRHWDNVKRAYQFTRANDSDGDGIYDNGQGTGWVESWLPTMPKQELYLAALDQQSSESISRLAHMMGEESLASSAKAQANLIRRKLAAYRGDDGIYAFSRNSDGSYDHTPTIFPSVAWWSGNLTLPDSDKTMELYAGSALSADWGLRAVAQTSPIYDPISYHQGTVWPLFTGWASLAEYRTARPLSAYAHLLANIDLTFASDPGNVTELLSGRFYEPLGRSTAHQLWSSAMVITPAVRGLFGIETDVPHHTLRIAPQLPSSWDHAALHNVPFGDAKLEVTIQRRITDLSVTVTSATSFPLCLTTKPGSISEDCAQAPSTKHTLTEPLPPIEVSLPHRTELPGESDSAPRVVSQQYGPRTLTLILELLGGSEVSLPLRFNLAKHPMLSVSGALLQDGKLLVKASHGKGYQSQRVEVTW